MLAIDRRALTMLSVFTLSLPFMAGVLAQNAPPAQKAAAPASAPTLTAPSVSDEKLKQVLATVNGENITRGEVYKLLSQYQVPVGKEEQTQVYKDAIDTLANIHLVNQFLSRQNMPISEKMIDDEVAAVERQSKSNGSDLPTDMRMSGTSMAELRSQFANRLRWIEYMNKKATDAELQSFVAAHKDLFNGTRVKVSHILLRTEPTTAAPDKEKLRQKLQGIKKDVLAGKLTFAEAANKYSEDVGNSEGPGGDLGYITLSDGFVDEFANPAFALKKGEMSNPVETPYGLHLILVTDRRDGTPFDFVQNKMLAKQSYAADLQKNLLAAQRKDAKIDVKPMPSDFFPNVQVAPAPTPSTGTPAAKPAAVK